MKNISLLLIALISFTSCAVTLKPSARIIEFNGIDFRKYSENGFLFTPLTYNEDKYEMKGIVAMNVYPEIRVISSNNSQVINAYKKDKWRIVRTTQGIAAVEIVNISELLDLFYEKALEMNADAVIKFDIISKEDFRLGLNNPITWYELYGYAIERKDN